MEIHPAYPQDTAVPGEPPYVPGERLGYSTQYERAQVGDIIASVMEGGRYVYYFDPELKLAGQVHSYHRRTGGFEGWDEITVVTETRILEDDPEPVRSEFTYDGIRRRGRVVSVKPSTSGIFLVGMLEEYNSRDGEHDEPVFKYFTADKIYGVAD